MHKSGMGTRRANVAATVPAITTLEPVMEKLVSTSKTTGVREVWRLYVQGTVCFNGLSILASKVDSISNSKKSSDRRTGWETYVESLRVSPNVPCRNLRISLEAKSRVFSLRWGSSSQNPFPYSSISSSSMSRSSREALSELPSVSSSSSSSERSWRNPIAVSSSTLIPRALSSRSRSAIKSFSSFFLSPHLMIRKIHRLTHVKRFE